MIKYRHNLPQLNGKTVLTDGGLETVMVFQEGIDLPLFAAFHLMDSEDGVRLLHRYFDLLHPACQTGGRRLPA